MPLSYAYSNPVSPSLNTRLETGLDTVRIGFFPCSASWENRKRLKSKGWYQSTPAKWMKKHKVSDMRVWHSEWWIGVEVSLPKLVAGNNSNMDYDHVDALAKLKQMIDDDIRLEFDSRTWTSPPWSEWRTNRVDVTADFILEDQSRVGHVLAQLKKATMVYRPNRHVQSGGVKWLTRAGRLACSAYNKFSESGRDADQGKVRFSVIINDNANKNHLRRYGIERVSGLLALDGMRCLEIVADEMNHLRPNKGVLPLVVSEAIEAHGA